MDKDRVEGFGHQVMGAVKQGLGKMLGDTKMETDGAAERVSGRAQNAAGGARDAVRDALDKTPPVTAEHRGETIEPGL